MRRQENRLWRSRRPFFNNEANEAELRYQIRAAGFAPRQPNILYNCTDRSVAANLDKSDSMKLKQLSVAFAD